MKISWSWLNEYINTELDVHEAAAILTSTGLEVEKVEKAEPIPGMLAGVVVGEVLTCVQHPNADKLKLTTVSIGAEENLSIVCGAPNVAAGQKVLVATVGCTLHPAGGDPFKIKKAKIRGEESHGMICAEDELGIGQGHDGIMVLDKDAVVGTEAAAFLGIKSEYVFEIGLTPNRADGMSHIGTARDLIAALNHRKELNEQVHWPSVDAYAKDNDDLNVEVAVHDEASCPRYAGVSLTNIEVAPSPKWLQERLLSIGMKPINNIVDVTNFVQLETGQPLHAFDADKISGNKVVVRKAEAGSTFKSLDELERKMDANDLMICDAEKAMCIAGVFGGIDSGVSETTKKVFLESALFDATTIRKTAKRQGLHTEASFRFERGVDPNGTIYALKRAALLMKEVCGAKISSEIFDHYPKPVAPFKVNLRYKMLDRMVGHSMNRDQVQKLLPLIDIAITGHDEEGLTLEVPPYRVDVTREIDVIEEIMRIHGFDQIQMPARLSVPMGAESKVPVEELCARVSEHWSSRGFSEIMTPSLVNAAEAIAGGGVKEEELVKLSNPLSSELDVMRPDMLAGGLGAINYNINRKSSDLRLFERGRVYRLNGEKHNEKQRFSLFMTGKYDVQIWRAEGRNVELADVKAELEMLIERLGVRGISMEKIEHELMVDANEIRVGQKVIATLGTVKPAFAKRFDVAQPVHYGELNVAELMALRKKQKVEYNVVSKFPSVRRDLSMLLDKSVRFEELKALAERNEKKLLKNVTLLDRFEGGKLPEGKMSYCLTFTLQDENQTLTDERIDKVVEKFFKVYEKEFEAERR